MKFSTGLDGLIWNGQGVQAPKPKNIAYNYEKYSQMRHVDLFDADKKWKLASSVEVYTEIRRLAQMNLHPESQEYEDIRRLIKATLVTSTSIYEKALTLHILPDYPYNPGNKQGKAPIDIIGQSSDVTLRALYDTETGRRISGEIFGKQISPLDVSKTLSTVTGIAEDNIRLSLISYLDGHLAPVFFQINESMSTHLDHLLIQVSEDPNFEGTAIGVRA